MSTLLPSLPPCLIPLICLAIDLPKRPSLSCRAKNTNLSLASTAQVGTVLSVLVIGPRCVLMKPVCGGSKSFSTLPPATSDSVEMHEEGEGEGEGC